MSRIAVSACMVLSVIVAVGCSLDPSGERPGFGLSGEIDSNPNPDWSVTDAHREISIETQTFYLLPHSVTTWCVTVGDRLYVAAMNPDEKYWVANVGRDSDVRLKIGDKLYERRLESLADPEMIDQINRAYTRKYNYRDEVPVVVAYWRVVSR